MDAPRIPELNTFDTVLAFPLSYLFTFAAISCFVLYKQLLDPLGADAQK